MTEKTKEEILNAAYDQVRGLPLREAFEIALKSLHILAARLDDIETDDAEVAAIGVIAGALSHHMGQEQAVVDV